MELILGATPPPTTNLVGAGLKRIVEGLRDAVHIPLHPALHCVLDLSGVVLHPEALALLTPAPRPRNGVRRTTS